jgi:hypothetical protein
MTTSMTRGITGIVLAMSAGSAALAQVPSDQSKEPIEPAAGVTITGFGSFGTAGASSGLGSHKIGRFEGLLARADGQTLSIALADQRVIRFRLDSKTRYLREGAAARLSGFRIADFVEVKADEAEHGYSLARSVSFLRKPTAGEEAEILQSPEVNYRHEENVIESIDIDPAKDTRRLSLVAKPDALRTASELDAHALKNTDPAGAGDNLIASIRSRVNSAFESLPNFRAKLVTSMFHSSTKNVKWIPNGVIAAEVAYEGKNEQYTEIQVNGKRPATAPVIADSEYMRSFNNAWSSGDFETISHCVFAGLQDSDFHKAATEHDAQGELAIYEFSGSRASTCVAVRSESQVAYPSYKGSLKVRTQTGDVLHVELEATNMPSGFPLDRAERSVDFVPVRVGTEQYLLPTTGYWFGCYRTSYYCFLNRMDFKEYRHFKSDSVVRFDAAN